MQHDSGIGRMGQFRVSGRAPSDPHRMVAALASEDLAWCPSLATIMLSLRNGPRLAAFDDPTSRAQPAFFSYSHRDDERMERLRTMLRPPEQRCGLVRWDDSRIQVGSL
jgi:hypothetical protein